MKKLALIIAPLLLVAGGLAQSRSCLRVMPVDELIRSSIWIGRVKIQKVSKANYRGMYSQLAAMHAEDIIDGNSTMTEVHVLAKSNVPCALDSYEANQDVLVFLTPEESLFRTSNFQYGEFLIVGDLVKGWRDKTNNVVDKPYAEVRKEIETYLQVLRHPQGQPVQPPQPANSNPSKPPEPFNKGMD
ncbi:MAG: hypothetical protein HY231_26370 [Acidobacteria bacterium]|nr:hypothetical protein [Acidobacteriota bacterium]